MARRKTAELGIGIITYNRRTALQGCVEGIRRCTSGPYRLVIADDGSEDGSAAWARSQGLPVLTGRRRGVVWNKNRALLYLLERTACDPILLLEDDAWPVEAGWEQAWIEAAERWSHVNFYYWTPNPDEVAGSGTPEAPYRSGRLTGQCTVTTRQALEVVGYLDTRFVGYGHGHVEWTIRFQRLLARRWGPPDATFPALRSGLRMREFGTYSNAADIARNDRWLHQLRNDPREPMWRPAWRNREEKLAARAEQAAVPGRSLGRTRERSRRALQLLGWLKGRMAHALPLPRM